MLKIYGMSIVSCVLQDKNLRDSNAGVSIVVPSGCDERPASPIRNGAGTGSRQGLRSCLPSAGDNVCAEAVWYVNCLMCFAGQKFA